LKEKTVVMKVDGNEALVRTIPDEKCSGCCSCGASKVRKFRVGIADTGPVLEGDILEVEVNALSMLRVYILIYVFPLFLFVVSLVAVHIFTGSPPASFAVSCLVLGAAYLFIGYFFRVNPSGLPAASVKKRR
jgi:positive regulator of sigma E activity